jgi:hypothetical protein
VTVPTVFFTLKICDVFGPEALQVIPRSTVVALHKLPPSDILPTADAENLFSIAVGKRFHVQPSPRSDRMDGSFGEQGCAGICRVTKEPEGVREVLPSIRFSRSEFSTIRAQDQGRGVICTAT